MAEDKIARPCHPEYDYDQSFLYDPTPLFWPLLHEIFTSRHAEVAIGGRARRIAAAPMYRPNRELNLNEIVNGRDGPSRDHMTTMVAMVAGQVWKKTHIIPDLCFAQLYRDGEDHVGWHTDYEALLGPDVGDPWVCIVSIGASRLLDFAPLPRLPGDAEQLTPCHTVKLTTGSLMWMRGATQRNFLHRIRPEPESRGPRISLTFTFDTPTERSGLPYMLMESWDDGERDLPMPLFVGSAEETLEYWKQLDDNDMLAGKRIRMVEPDGAPT